MLWGIISCSIPSQEGVCVFFILFSYVYIFLPDSVFCLPFLFLFVGGFLSGILPVNFYGEITGSKKLMGEQIKPCFRFFFFSCAGLLCGLVLAGPIIEELGYFLTSAALLLLEYLFRSCCF